MEPLAASTHVPTDSNQPEHRKLVKHKLPQGCVQRHRWSSGRIHLCHRRDLRIFLKSWRQETCIVGGGAVWKMCKLSRGLAAESKGCGKMEDDEVGEEIRIGQSE